jgi:hypothetical protein
VPKLDVLLGCSWVDFVAYVDPLLTVAGWEWKGFGTEWTCDHKLPINAFNVCDPDELLACNYFTNIDVLTLEQNASKNGTFDTLERDEYLREWREDTAIDVCEPF